MTDVTNYLTHHACANCGADASVTRVSACCESPVIMNGPAPMTDMQKMLAGMVRYDAVLALQDPVAVHANMLRGTIAKPSWANILHLYPVESLALVAAAYADAAIYLRNEAADKGNTKTPQGRSALHYARKLAARTPTGATAALARMLADARAEGLADLLMVERMDDVSAVCREYRIKEPSFRAALRALAGSDAP